MRRRSGWLKARRIRSSAVRSFLKDRAPRQLRSGREAEWCAPAVGRGTSSREASGWPPRQLLATPGPTASLRGARHGPARPPLPWRRTDLVPEQRPSRQAPSQPRLIAAGPAGGNRAVQGETPPARRRSRQCCENARLGSTSATAHAELGDREHLATLARVEPPAEQKDAHPPLQQNPPFPFALLLQSLQEHTTINKNCWSTVKEGK